MRPEVKKEALRVTDMLAETAQQYIADGHEHAATLFCLFLEDGQYQVHTVVLAPLPDENRGKEAIAYALGQMVEKYDAYVFLTEGWMVKQDKEDPPLNVRPSQHPKRIETFQLHFVTKLGDELFRTWHILRHTDKPAELVHDHDTEIPTAGRFANFFEFSIGTTKGSH
jgi:hypothetical protein